MTRSYPSIADPRDANTNNRYKYKYIWKGQCIITFCCVAPGCDQIMPVADHSNANTNLDTNTDINPDANTNTIVYGNTCDQIISITPVSVQLHLYKCKNKYTNSSDICRNTTLTWLFALNGGKFGHRRPKKSPFLERDSELTIKSDTGLLPKN